MWHNFMQDAQKLASQPCSPRNLAFVFFRKLRSLVLLHPSIEYGAQSAVITEQLNRLYKPKCLYPKLLR